MTRARRSGGSPFDSTTLGPLCQSTAPICRSFTEMVWWDGDQALIETRVAEGTSDVSNNGSVGNIHGLTLDEPLAVITTNPSNETRIINYNWRGQGLSSVFPNGAGADFATGNAGTEIDWPAMTQAQTYFTPSLDAAATDNNPKKWMGTFVQNGQGTTGMLYRRNRYFDTNTGRFTQEDPIGIAGGLNTYGFGAGDPVNFSDPFGLLVCDRDHPEECTLKDVGRNFLAGLGAIGSGDFRDTGPGWKIGMFLGQVGLGFGVRAPVGQGLRAASAVAVSASDVSEILMTGGSPIGSAGSRATIRELSGGLDEATKMFGKLSRGGTMVPSDYPGTLVRLPNGGTVGLRTIMSRSTGTVATIDLNIKNIPITKLKFNP